MSFLTGMRARAVPVLLAIFLAGGSLADCMATVESAGAEMVCCAKTHHDASCPMDTKAAKAAPCCKDGPLQQSQGFVAAKQERITAPTAVSFLLTAVVTALPGAPARARLVSSIDTGPPFSPTRRHIVLSVFLI